LAPTKLKSKDMSAKQAFERRSVRATAVAGQFYPADPDVLRAEVSTYLKAARPFQGALPKAVITPHAGYMYSGPIAGSVFAHLVPGRESVSRVVLIGPSHYAAFPGLACSSATSFASPLGEVPVDEQSLDRARSLSQVIALDPAHRPEHCLEVQLPFLQSIFSSFKIVPLLVGDAAAYEVSQVLNLLWGGPETCIVVSSDLSHYHDYRTAQRLDAATAAAIESLDEQHLSGDQACGCRAIGGLLVSCREHDLRCQQVDLRNSGDTAGRRDRVVGYGGFVFRDR
jgi:MEMO1 family protein